MLMCREFFSSAILAIFWYQNTILSAGDIPKTDSVKKNVCFENKSKTKRLINTYWTNKVRRWIYQSDLMN